MTILKNTYIRALKALSMSYIAIFVLLIGASTTVFSQDVSVEIGRNTIALNEYFELTVTVKNGEIQKYSKFPTISGMDKAETYTSQSIQIINGQVSQTNTLTQRYRAPRKGTYYLRPFSMTVNGEQVRHAGATIDVKAGNGGAQDPYQQFYKPSEEGLDFQTAKSDAFFAITFNKDEAYVGEGFTMTMAFYKARKDRNKIDFYELANQKAEIIQKIRPKNVVEENFNIVQPIPETVTINGKLYSKYSVYQAVFYSLSPQKISIPMIPFKMVTYAYATNRANAYKEVFKTFYSEPTSMEIKELPPHPLREQVPVGNYTLKEQITDRNLETGQNFQYQFLIEGEGNLSVISKPVIPPTSNFDFYEPKISEVLRRNNNTVYGAKAFTYNIIPNESGLYQMEDYFSMVFFNTKEDRYDTLQSAFTLSVTGESRKNASLESTDLGTFYDRINDENNKLRNRDEALWEKYLINGIGLFLVVGLIGSIWIGKRLRQKDQDREY